MIVSSIVLHVGALFMYNLLFLFTLANWSSGERRRRTEGEAAQIRRESYRVPGTWYIVMIMFENSLLELFSEASLFDQN